MELPQYMSNEQGISYEQMKPGQLLTVHAMDAFTKGPSFFLVEVLSVRDERKNQMAATLRYRGGNFNFYNGENTSKAIKLADGDLFENGISGTLIPLTDLRMSYYGGIGVGRDHLFDFVNGRNKSVIAHKISVIDVSNPTAGWLSPDLSEHFKKIEETKGRQDRNRQEATKNTENSIDQFINEKFKSHPKVGEIQKMLSEFSPNGKVAIASFLGYALEDGVFEKAWQILDKANYDHFTYQPPMVRGDMDILGQNRVKIMEMIREAGITWPRLDKEPEVDLDGPMPGEIGVIILGQDPILREKLVRKVAEYKSRFNWPNPDNVISARHKALVLQTVLERSTVTLGELRSILSKENWFNEDAFETAVWIINEYVSTSGKGRVVGGTGLS